MVAHTGSVSVVQALLAGGSVTVIDEKDIDNCSALHIALMSDQVDIAQVLIAAGANLNDKNIMGFTPLQCAEKYVDSGNSSAITEALRAAGALPTHSLYHNID